MDAKKGKDLFYQLLDLPGLLGVMVMTGDGLAIRSTINPEDTLKLAFGFAPLVSKARTIMQELQIEDEHETTSHRHHRKSKFHHMEDMLNIIRIRTNKYEIYISPCDNFGYVTIAIQKARLDNDDDEDDVIGDTSKA